MNSSLNNTITEYLSCTNTFFIQHMFDTNYEFITKHTNSSFTDINLTSHKFIVGQDSIIDIISNNALIMIVYDSRLEIFSFCNSTNRLKHLKSITISCMFYYNFKNTKIKRFFYGILLNILNIPKYDCYLEGIIKYLDGENIVSIKYLENDVIEVTYKNTNIKYYNHNLMELKGIPTSLKQIKSDQITTTKCIIKMANNEILTYRNDSNYVNRKKINYKKYFINSDKIVIVTRKNEIVILKN